MRKIIYILGTNNCGSTIVNLVLNGHSKMLGLSEVLKIDEFVNRGDKNYYFEGLLKSEPFWANVNTCYQKCCGRSLSKSGITYPSWTEMMKDKGSFFKEWGQLNQTLFDCISEQLPEENKGKQIFIDSSKISKRLFLFF
ncbi:MAG: hypothetical protein AB4372_26730 [Xenococcus sp. (in: cyanobacteria)]